MTYVVFLDDLLEARVVQLSELGQIVDVSDDVAEVGLEEEEIFVSRTIGSTGPGVETRDSFIDLSLTRLNAADDLLTLDLLEGEDLVEFTLEQRHEAFLIFLSPGLAVGLGIVRGGLGDELSLEGVLEVFIGNVMPVELLDHGRPQLLAEPERGNVSIV